MKRYLTFYGNDWEHPEPGMLSFIGDFDKLKIAVNMITEHQRSEIEQSRYFERNYFCQVYDSKKRVICHTQNSVSRKLISADLIAFAHEKREKAKKLREEKDAEDVIAARNKFIAHCTENQAKLKQND
jgi:hypothetical protein